MWQILINGPGYFDTRYDLPQGETHLGRADENDVVLTGDQVSRRHARMRVTGASVAIEDLGSRNGTQLNGQPLAAPATLKDGDVIHVGENTLTLKGAGEAEVARTEMLDASSGQISSYAADLAGQVLVSRDLRENSFLAGLEQARTLSIAAIESAPASPQGEEMQALLLLYKVVEKLSRASSLDAFLHEMLDLVMDLAHAKTGVILLRNAKGTYSPVAVRHTAKLGKGEVPISDGIVAEVIKKKVTVCVADVRDDARFANRESVILYGVNQVLCAPMIYDGAIVGLIYLNREASPERGLDRLLDLLSAVAQLGASGAQQARLKAKAQSEEKIRRALERFHAPDVVDRVVKELGKGQDPSSRVEEKVATIAFADISGFTALTERLPAERVLDLLNQFYRRMTGVIFSYGGTVDKFIGDAVMAIFGAPYARGDDAARAVRAALAMRQEFRELVSQGRPDERCEIKIGLNTGRVLAGIVGSEARLEYTALGDPVNIAARVQDSALPGQVLITRATLEAAGKRFQVRPLGERQLKGKNERVAVFEVLDEDLEWTTSPGI